MENVWASHHQIQAAWSDSRVTFQHVFSFNSLTELCGEMGRNGLRGRVNVLAVVAHGGSDLGGSVRLDRILTVESVGNFDDEFQLLRRYIIRDGFLIFYSCAAGFGSAGTELLKKVSGKLPTRTIIGFTVWGITGPHGVTHPGFMGFTHYPDVTRSEGLIDVTGPYANWARDGEIIRSATS